MKSIRNFLNPLRSPWLAVALLTGAGLGWWSRPQPAAERPRPAALVPSPPVPAAERSWTEKQLAALHAGTPAQQILAALRLAEVPGTVEDIRALLDNSHAFPKNAAAGLAVNVLLCRWLELDAPAALAYADLRHHGHWGGLLAAYTVAHPAQAEAYGHTLPDGKTSQEAWEAIGEGLIAAHPAEAWKLLEREGDRSRDHLVRKLAALDVEDTLSRLDTLSYGWRDIARKVIAAELAKQNPDRALAWIAQQPEQRGLLDEVIAVVYRKDPARAFGLLERLSGQDLINALSNLTWDDQHGNPVLKLQQTGTVRDRAALAAAVMGSPLEEKQKATLLDHFFWQDPGRGQAFWEHFSEKEQLGKLPALLYRWSALDKTSAGAWWKGLPEGPVRAAAETHWQELEAAWTRQGQSEAARLFMAIRSGDYPRRTDPRLAGLTADELSGLVSAFPKPDYGSVNAMIQTVGTSNPEAVARWLESASVTKEAGRSVAEFTVRWAMDDPAAAAAWARRLPEGELASLVAFNIARQYRAYHPAVVQEWAAGLKAKSGQQAARRALQGEGIIDSE